MTDEEVVALVNLKRAELAAAVQSIATMAGGQLCAATVILRAIQFLPGFDRRQFLDLVSIHQLALEKAEPMESEIQKHFAEHLERLCKPLELASSTRGNPGPSAPS